MKHQIKSNQHKSNQTQFITKIKFKIRTKLNIKSNQTKPKQHHDKSSQTSIKPTWISNQIESNSTQIKSN